MFTNPTIDEIQNKTITKPSLSSRIAQHQVDGLLAAMGSTGEHVRIASTVIPAIGRDRKDDYLITYSQAGRATHLATGDRDLLEIKDDFGFRILTPATFLALLNAESD